MSIERFNEGLLIGLSISGVSHIKKLYNVNHEFVEQFKDGLLLSKVLQLEAKYSLNTILSYIFEEDVNPNPPTPPPDDSNIYLISRFNIKTEVLTSHSRRLLINIVDGGLRLKTILSIIGSVTELSIEDRYSLKSSLEVLLHKYRGIYAECMYKLKTDVSVIKHIEDKKMLEIEEKYLLSTILEIEGAISKLEGAVSDIYALDTSIGIIKHNYYKLNIKDRLLFNTIIDVVFRGSNSYREGVVSNYILNDFISIVKESFGDVGEEDGDLTEYIIVEDDLNIVIKDIIHLKNEVNIGKIEDSVVKIGLGGVLEEHILDDLEFNVSDNVSNVVKDINSNFIGDIVIIDDDVSVVINSID